MMVTRDPYKAPTLGKLAQSAMERKRTQSINRINSAKIAQGTNGGIVIHNRASQHAHYAA